MAQYFHVFDNLTDAMAAKLPEGVVVKTKGELVAGDGGGGEYLTGASGVDPNKPASVTGAAVLATSSTTERTLGERFSDRTNVKDYGAVVDGTTDNWDALIAAQAGGTGRLFLPSSDSAYVLTDGANKEIKRGIDGNNQQIIGKLRLSRPEDNLWKYTSHRDIRITNPGGTCIELSPNDQFTGRHVFENVYCREASIGFDQPAGNIGCGYYRISTSQCDYGYRAKGYADPTFPTHAGAMRMEQAHFSNSAIAGIYINDEEEGLGGYSLNDVIVEDGNGFGIFMKGSGRTSFNKVKLNGFWCENDLRSSPPVVIDGRTLQPRVLRIEDFKGVTITDSYIYDMEVINSDVLLDRCRIDADFLFDLVIDIDEASTVRAKDVIIGLSGTTSKLENILVESVQRCEVNSSFRYVSLKMPAPKVSRQDTYASTLLGERMDTPQTWTTTDSGGPKTGVVTIDPTTSNRANQFTISGGGLRVYSPTINLNVADGKWVTWSVSIKVDSGELDALWQQNFTLGSAYTKQGEWITTRGITMIQPGDGNTTRLWLTSVGGPCTFRIADIYVKYHETEDEALQALNSESTFYRIDSGFTGGVAVDANDAATTTTIDVREGKIIGVTNT